MSLWGTKNDNVWPLRHILNHVMVVIFVIMIFVPHMHFPLRIYRQDQHPTIYIITVPSLVQDHAEHACQLVMDSHMLNLCSYSPERGTIEQTSWNSGQNWSYSNPPQWCGTWKRPSEFCQKKKKVPKIIKQHHLQSSMFWELMAYLTLPC